MTHLLCNFGSLFLLKFFKVFFDHSPYTTFNGKGKSISTGNIMTMLKFLSHVTIYFIAHLFLLMTTIIVQILLKQNWKVKLIGFVINTCAWFYMQTRSCLKWMKMRRIYFMTYRMFHNNVNPTSILLRTKLLSYA